MARLILAGSLWFTAGPVPATLFRLPLSSNTSVHYYYDHGSLTDWKCGGETYSGHRGSDFSGGPRGRAIYAAAVGTLSYKIDGFGDGYWGSTDGGGFGNHVRLTHSGGFLTIYGHMTSGSVTTKSVNSSIACGEQIGGIGTSGNSTGFHLHFQVNVNGVADDPYQGTCGGPLTYWVNQNNGNPVTTCEGGSGTDDATFVSENYPDGSVLSPGQAFTKQFVMNNSGTTTWTANGTNGYTLKHTSDSPSSPNLGAALHTVPSGNVAPGANYTFNIPLTAPITPGTYQANFQMKNSAGASFGNSVWVNIVVSTPSAPSAPIANAATSVTGSSFTANWSSSSGATGYRLDVSTNNTFGSYVAGYQDLDVGNVTSRSVTGLAAGKTYYYRVRAYNAGGTSGNSGIISVTLLAAPSCTPGILANPDFEGGDTGGVATGWTAYEVDSPSIKVWTIQTASAPEALQYQQVQAYNAAHTASAGVRQDVTGCTIGATYRISGWYRSNSDNGRARVRVSPTASMDWSTAIDLNPAADYGSGTNWATFSGTVVPTGPTMTLWLDGRTIGGTSAKVGCFDGVSVTCEGAAVPLHFDSVAWLAQKQARLVLSGEPGGSVTILRSSNLVEWLLLTNLINTDGTLEFTDTSTTNTLHRFYRATSP